MDDRADAGRRVSGMRLSRDSGEKPAIGAPARMPVEVNHSGLPLATEGFQQFTPATLDRRDILPRGITCRNDHRPDNPNRPLLAPSGPKGAEAGAGAMLVACRLAGLSALEGHYAGLNAGAQFGPTQRLQAAFRPFRPEGYPESLLKNCSPLRGFICR